MTYVNSNSLSGLPPGGLPGQTLLKSSGTDGDADWQDLSGFAYFSIWAEENSTLVAGGNEWSFGNGAETPTSGGIVVPIDCELYAGSFVGAGTVSISALRNGIGVEIITSTLTTFGAPTQFSAGDILSFQTLSAVGSGTPNTVTAHFRVGSQAGADGNTILSGNVPPTTEGVNGDFYIDLNTSTLYGPKALNAWPSGISLKGESGLNGQNGADGQDGADGDAGLAFGQFDINPDGELILDYLGQEDQNSFAIDANGFLLATT